MKVIKVTTKTYLGNRMYGFVCPVCDSILACWCDMEIAPLFATCDCQVRGAEKHYLK